MPRHYLDHASTSPPRREVVEAMLPWLSGQGAADPGRVHTEGRMARSAIEAAREQIAALMGARNREIIFTSGATESINAAVFGATEESKTKSKRTAHVVSPAVEHSAVLDSSCRHDLTVVPVDGTGRVDSNEVIDAIGPETALVHCQWGNHEIGTLQPVKEIVEGCRERGVLVHVDAAQAAGHVPINFDSLGADLMSVSAHKMGGPKGIGALLIRRGLRLPPLLAGGDQERARRGGMENVAGIVGFGATASALSGTYLEEEAARAQHQTDTLTRRLQNTGGVTIFGDTTNRLPHIVCCSVAGVEAEPILLGLDQQGIAIHSGSSCSSESLEPSPVLAAMGVDAEHSLRVSVGWSTDDSDIAAFVDTFPGVIDSLRALR